MNTKIVFSAAIIASLNLSGCATSPGTILEKQITLDGNGHIVGTTTGARQRIITTHPPTPLSPPGQVEPYDVVCVEPSPDVALAIANSFGTGFSLLGKGSASITGSTAEGVAQLAERTVSIQALLKQGYQACLDYANGAITRTTYSLRTAKLDDLLVTLVLGEIAGGAYGRSGASIGGKSSADATAKLSGLAAIRGDIDDTRKRMEQGEAQLAADEQALADEKTKNATLTGDDKVASDETIKSLEIKIKADKAVLAAVKENLTALANTLSKSVAEITNVTGIGGLDHSPNADIAKIISEMQERFLSKDTDHAFVSACLTELADARQSLYTDKDKKQKFTTNQLDLIVKINEQATKSELSLDEADEKTFRIASALNRFNPNPTHLLEYCQKNLQGFLHASQKNRHELALKKLEVRLEEIRAAARAAVPAPKPTPKTVHPAAELAKLKRDHLLLISSKAELNDAKVTAALNALKPDVKKPLKDAFDALNNEINALLIKTTGAVSANGESIIDSIENEYRAIIEDQAQHGDTAERKVWEQRLALQQARAKQKATELSGLALAGRQLSTRSKTLIGEIKKAV